MVERGRLLVCKNSSKADSTAGGRLAGNAGGRVPPIAIFADLALCSAMRWWARVTEGLRRRVIMPGRITHRGFITVNEPGRSWMNGTVKRPRSEQIADSSEVTATLSIWGQYCCII